MLSSLFSSVNTVLCDLYLDAHLPAAMQFSPTSSWHAAPAPCNVSTCSGSWHTASVLLVGICRNPCGQWASVCTSASPGSPEEQSPHAFGHSVCIFCLISRSTSAQPPRMYKPLQLSIALPVASAKLVARLSQHDTPTSHSGGTTGGSFRFEQHLAAWQVTGHNSRSCSRTGGGGREGQSITKTIKRRSVEKNCFHTKSSQATTLTSA